MASQINPSPIDQTYPEAGVDNDTQGFRDNFNYIKIALTTARDEVSALQNKTGGLACTAIVSGNNEIGSDFDDRILARAVFKENSESLLNFGSPVQNEIEVNFGNANHQVIKCIGNRSLLFTGFPTVNAAKMTLELYGDGTERTITFSLDNPTIKTLNFPVGGLKVTSATNPVILEIVTRAQSTEPVLGRTIFINYIGQFV